MCRWIAYQGSSIYLENLLFEPEHSLIHQAVHAAESFYEVNGDGFSAWRAQTLAAGCRVQSCHSAGLRCASIQLLRRFEIPWATIHSSAAGLSQEHR